MKSTFRVYFGSRKKYPGLKSSLYVCFSDIWNYQAVVTLQISGFTLWQVTVSKWLQTKHISPVKNLCNSGKWSGTTRKLICPMNDFHFKILDKIIKACMCISMSKGGFGAKAPSPPQKKKNCKIMPNQWVFMIFTTQPPQKLANFLKPPTRANPGHLPDGGGGNYACERGLAYHTLIICMNENNGLWVFSKTAKQNHRFVCTCNAVNIFGPIKMILDS